MEKYGTVDNKDGVCRWNNNYCYISALISYSSRMLDRKVYRKGTQDFYFASGKKRKEENKTL